MSVLIIVPVLQRPERVAPLLNSIEAATPEPHSVLFVCTEHDDEEHDAIVDVSGEMLILPGARQPGDYARKINAAYRWPQFTEPNLFLAADDLVFHPGWYSTAADLLSETVQVVGTNDLGNARVMGGRHSTHTLVTRRYCDQRGTIDGPGEVLHEGYNHWYVDDEFIQTAQARGTFAPCLESIVEHLHPAWNKGPEDAVYRLGQSKSSRDRRIYEGRQPRIATAA